MTTTIRIVLMLLGLSWTIAAGAETGTALTLDQKVAAADTIVHARCVQTSTQWRNGLVFTLAEYEVIENMRGKGANRIDLVIPGGTAVHPTLGVPLTTKLSNGVQVAIDDEVIFFAAKNANGEIRLVASEQAYLRLVNDAQGIKRVRSDERRVLATPSAENATAAVDTSTDVFTEEFSVDGFKERLRLSIAKDAPARVTP